MGREISDDRSLVAARVEHVPFFAFPPEVRRVSYITNVIESLHVQLRKTRGQFPNDDAAIKLIWLAPRNISDGNARSARE
jgi:putative transposase